MHRLEDLIRDYLSENLELLEQGLDLVQMEFPIHSQDGAGGRIDIVAKDRFGLFVVIEIKRSNQAARQALNEINKYTALFRKQQGLDERNVRLVVVSTEWHELLVPLSEFAAISPYSVEGISICADANGVVSNASRVLLDAAKRGDGAFEISHQQMLYLYESKESRHCSLDTLAAKINEVGISDFVLMKCDYQGTNSAVIYPFGLYLFFSSPLKGNDLEWIKFLKRKIPWDKTLWDPDENFLCELNDRCSFDTLEIGLPEKLTNMQVDWHFCVEQRRGRFRMPDSVITDDELIKLAQKTSGGSRHYYSKKTSPKFASAWSAFCEDFVRVLECYPKWKAVLPKYFREVEKKWPDAEVTAAVHGPSNLIAGLYAFHVIGQNIWWPRLEVIVTDSEGQPISCIIGAVVWNGIPIAQTFSDLVEPVFGDVFGWALATNLHDTSRADPAVAASHNLEAVIAEFQDRGTGDRQPRELVVNRGRLKRLKPEEWTYASIAEFLDAHELYLNDLQQSLDENSSGLLDSLLRSAGIPRTTLDDEEVPKKRKKKTATKKAATKNAATKKKSPTSRSGRSAESGDIQ